MTPIYLSLFVDVRQKCNVNNVKQTHIGLSANRHHHFGFGVPGQKLSRSVNVKSFTIAHVALIKPVTTKFLFNTAAANEINSMSKDVANKLTKTICKHEV